MEPHEIPTLLLDNIPYSVVLVDLEHTIRYLNEAGKRNYAKWGDILGKSLFHCHNDKSRQVIIQYIERLRAGEDEILYVDKPTHRAYIRSVRDKARKLVGYYEMYAPPRER